MRASSPWSDRPQGAAREALRLCTTRGAGDSGRWANGPAREVSMPRGRSQRVRVAQAACSQCRGARGASEEKVPDFPESTCSCQPAAGACSPPPTPRCASPAPGGGSGTGRRRPSRGPFLREAAAARPPGPSPRRPRRARLQGQTEENTSTAHPHQPRGAAASSHSPGSGLFLPPGTLRWEQVGSSFLPNCSEHARHPREQGLQGACRAFLGSSVPGIHWNLSQHVGGRSR
nr:interleukin-34 isoform X1 [Chrysemys picta bellii]